MAFVPIYLLHRQEASRTTTYMYDNIYIGNIIFIRKATIMILKNALINDTVTDIIIESGKIADVCKTELHGIDLNGSRVIPGLIDIHAHGCVGHDTMDGEFSEMSQYLARNGTTSWYPTTMTAPFSRINKITASKLPESGANIPGFHLEGPYISKKYKGAQNEIYIKNPDIHDVENTERVKLITLAPELDGSVEFIKSINAVVCIGHTDADYETAVKAAHAGCRCLTHTFNAMPPFHHREPSVIGAAITEDMYVQVICDGLHIHRAAILALYRIFGKDRMILISDSMRATGMPDGQYEFGGQNIIVKDHIARTEYGAIAGSTSTLMTCVKKAVEFGIPFDDAVYMASQTPAELMGINKGRIEKGFDADLLVVDSKLNISHVIINGEIF